MKRIKEVLLVECDPLAVREFHALLEQDHSMQLVFQTESWTEALKYLRVHSVDVLFLSYEAKEGEDHRLRELTVCGAHKPLVLVTTTTQDAGVWRQLRADGADVIYLKTNPAYSPARMVALAKELGAYANQPEETPVTYAASDRFERSVIAFRLEQMGFKRRYVAFSYAVDAVAYLLAAGDANVRITADVYPMLAERYQMSVISVERSLRSAIKSVFTGVPPKKMYRDYPFPYDLCRGYPTNSEFLNNLASWLRKDADVFAENEPSEEENGE